MLKAHPDPVPPVGARPRAASATPVKSLRRRRIKKEPRDVVGQPGVVACLFCGGVSSSLLLLSGRDEVRHGGVRPYRASAILLFDPLACFLPDGVCAVLLLIR